MCVCGGVAVVDKKAVVVTMCGEVGPHHTTTTQFVVRSQVIKIFQICCKKYLHHEHLWQLADLPSQVMAFCQS